MYNIHTITIYIVVNNHSTTLFFTILLCVNLLRASFLASPANLFGRPRQAAKDSLTSPKWRPLPTTAKLHVIKGEKYRGGGFAFPPSQRLLPQIIPGQTLAIPREMTPSWPISCPLFWGAPFMVKIPGAGLGGTFTFLLPPNGGTRHHARPRDAEPANFTQSLKTGHFFWYFLAFIRPFWI